MLMFRLLFTDSTTHGFPFAALLLDPSRLGVCTIHGLILPFMEEDFPTFDVNCQFTFRAVILHLHCFPFQYCISYI
ncbi:hypothetical protein DFH08DRAFT_900458 [Mycena albidolilacea]|uniref:Uncharacterized protein n=1 Tax=Mycena albidolilacea TaxID=1033008 RepID=A0AAD6Z4W1_9AGAR|nr:hypothetical protein DFH08DRAFT_900458 [Mycena albidolilacea]